MFEFRTWIIGSGFALLVASPANACNPLLSSVNPRPTTASTQQTSPEIIAPLVPSSRAVVTLHVCNIGTVDVRLSPSNAGAPFVTLAADECKVVTAPSLFLRTTSGFLLPAGQIAYCVVSTAFIP